MEWRCSRLPNMADIVKAICARLSAHSGTNALISGRAWDDHLPQNPVYPACLVRSVSDIPTRAFGADSEKRQARIQVNCYATTRDGVIALGEQVFDALSRWGGVAASVTVDQSFHDNTPVKARWDDDVRKYVTIHDFFPVWYTE